MEERKAPWEPRSFYGVESRTDNASFKESAFHLGKGAPACASHPETVETRRTGMPRKKEEEKLRGKFSLCIVPL
jgi:hypothetical protein